MTDGRQLLIDTGASECNANNVLALSLVFQSSKTEKHSLVDPEDEEKQSALHILSSFWKMCEEGEGHMSTYT